ncbi:MULTISPECIES: ABC transporter substrate-binding protein [unclassified Pseudomonas]|uniref:ABC transporter substrate-binding protein n=1 Tax=unclassified Pseudomonas TaxID=196821 RepID=UPI0004D7C375|nr:MULTISPECIES: ABC transporter substrate-binding protein [unclassified Pseudomonas]KES25545.1 ABC transporter substrate-binding protein [Pseudomonas sp. AAC]OHR89182.1 ABC transporter substrate-binding protein [Pseudomonas sp. HMSC75E02]
MKQRFAGKAGWLAALALLGVLALAAPAMAAVTGTLETGRLSIGSDLTYPPYAYLEQSQPAGFDPEFMRALGKQLQLQPEFRDTRFANLVMGVNARRFDVVASALYVTPERARQVDFLPYLKSGASLMVRSDDDFRPQRAEDLCGKRVASIKGGSWIPRLLEVSRDYCVAQGKPAIQSREFPTSPEAAQALLAKAVDVQFENAAVAKITAEKLQGRLQIASRELIYPVVIGLAVRKGNGELLDGLRQGFEAMKQDGEYQALLARYNLAEPSAADVAQALGN